MLSSSSSTSCPDLVNEMKNIRRDRSYASSQTRGQDGGWTRSQGSRDSASATQAVCNANLVIDLPANNMATRARWRVWRCSVARSSRTRSKSWKRTCSTSHPCSTGPNRSPSSVLVRTPYSGSSRLSSGRT
ncbi:hypothetical protein WOLCODRAFT_138060 [Wolfiporia cocos MD-104 SS10]|uniref:Uncharacterized protein n=1 Tax=Wolfiporia cocos (strain MD-104) TaxID=742152 RepID=A0A2H3JKP2_WOLCO|nr:hypothetical protein WOLCODRAFT_138060 [Wolfiporia cocos MD-104 SS10]